MLPKIKSIAMNLITKNIKTLFMINSLAFYACTGIMENQFLHPSLRIKKKMSVNICSLFLVNPDRKSQKDNHQAEKNNHCQASTISINNIWAFYL